MRHDASHSDDCGDLHRLLASHDPMAFEYLYHYAARLEAALQRRFGAIIAPEDIKDIVRDGLIHAFETGERFDPSIARLATWLNQLVHYRALEFLRRNPNTRPISMALNMAPMPVEPRPSDVEQPSDSIEHILQALPPRRAQIVRMHYYERRSFAEIARILKISEGAVKSHLCHGRHSLREELEKEHAV